MKNTINDDHKRAGCVLDFFMKSHNSSVTNKRELISRELMTIF